MTKEAEKNTISREMVNELAEKVFPNLSKPLLVELAIQFELSQN